jgi:hypothetical protein
VGIFSLSREESLLPRWNLATKIAAITGVVGVAAGVLSQLANIGESVYKLSSLLFGTPASISIRDVRPGASKFLHADPLRPAFISVNVELVVINIRRQSRYQLQRRVKFFNSCGGLPLREQYDKTE